MSRKINAKELAQDLNEGMHRNVLMNKYELSPRQLDALIAKLEAAGLIAKAAPPTEPTEHIPEQEEPHACPVCGLTLSEPVEVCPRCGIVLSKVTGALPASEMGPATRSAAQQLPQHSPLPRPWSMPMVIVAVAGVVVLLVAVLVWFMSDDTSRHDALAPSKHEPTAGQSRTPGAHPYKNIPAPPNLREINPAVDREMRKQLKDLDQGLSQGQDALRQSGEE